jgi:hypothetical protein
MVLPKILKFSHSKLNLNCILNINVFLQNFITNICTTNKIQHDAQFSGVSFINYWFLNMEFTCDDK